MSEPTGPAVGIAVAVDARRLQDQPIGGVGRALAGLHPELARRCDVTLLTDARRPAPPTGLRTEALSLPAGLPEVAWLHGPARRWCRAHPQLVHGTFNALPSGLRGPSVVTIHDLSFGVHPEDFGSAKRRLFQLQARAAAKRAGQVITVSRFTADELVEHYRLDPDRIRVIPHAVDPRFSPDRAPSDPPARPYVVAVGGARRRGLEVAVAAWRTVRARGVDVELRVLGGPAPAPELGLVPLGALDDDAWAATLAGASALVYPTRYEGFGLPALEAAASGTPVVCARVASLPEVLGPAAAWCDTPTSDQIADRLAAVLTEPSLAAELRAAGLERAAATPSWAEIADAHVEAYRAAGA